MARANPIDGFAVDPADIRYVGSDLERPECILAERDGTLWASDARGGVTRIAPDGSQSLLLPPEVPEGSVPNGLAFDAHGNILVANFGIGALELLGRDGSHRTLIDSIDGRPVGCANFVTRDRKGRLWLTVTTRLVPWTRHVETGSEDGYIAVIDDKGARIVADGLGGTNELRFDENEEWAYVAETGAWRISRFRVGADGSLSQRETYGPENVGGYCDGIAFDAHGNLWSTLVFLDRLIAITPEGELRILLDDGNAAAAAVLEEAWRKKSVTLPLLGACRGTIAPGMASVTFGGPDLRTVYLGSLLGTRIPFFRSPVAGQPLIYW